MNTKNTSSSSATISPLVFFFKDTTEPGYMQSNQNLDSTNISKKSTNNTIKSYEQYIKTLSIQYDSAMMLDNHYPWIHPLLFQYSNP